MGYYIGLDIGGTKCAVTLGWLTDSSVDIRDKYKFATIKNNPYDVLSTFDRRVGEYSRDNTIEGIGISCGGPLDSKKGVILGPPNLPGWDHIEIVRYFQERYRVPVYLQNDANACAVAEWKYGAGRGCNNMVFLTFGTGLGAGLILDGKLYAGTNDMAGEVGHWRLWKDGPLGYGKAGSFEGFCSGGGIAALARSKAESGQCLRLLKEAGTPSAITAKLVGDLAEQGDADCQEIYAQCGRMLGKGLALIIDILNPQTIVIGSIFTRSRELLWQYAKEEIDREALAISAGVCEVKTAQLGEMIGDYAALTLASGEY